MSSFQRFKRYTILPSLNLYGGGTNGCLTMCQKHRTNTHICTYSTCTRATSYIYTYVHSTHTIYESVVCVWPWPSPERLPPVQRPVQGTWSSEAAGRSLWTWSWRMVSPVCLGSASPYLRGGREGEKREKYMVENGYAYTYVVGEQEWANLVVQLAWLFVSIRWGHTPYTALRTSKSANF